MKILTDSEYRKLFGYFKHETAKARRELSRQIAKNERQQAIIAEIFKTSKESSKEYEEKLRKKDEEIAVLRAISNTPVISQEKTPKFGDIDGRWQ